MKDHKRLNPILAILILLMSGVSAFAQNNPYKIDDRIYPLYVRAMNHRSQPIAVNYADSIVELAKKYNDLKAEVLAYTIPLSYSVQSKNIEETHKWAEVLRAKARENDYLQYYYYAYNQEATTFLNNQKYAEAVNLLGNMRAEANAENNSYGLYTSLNTLGHVYHVISNLNSAEEMYVQAAKIIEKDLPDQTPSGAWMNASDVAIKNEKYNQALTYIENAQKSYMSERIKFNVLESKAVCHYMLGQLDLAQKDCNEYFNLQQSMGNNETKKLFRAQIIQELLNGNYEKALEIAKGVNDFSDSCYLMIECYKKLGDYQSALITEQLRRRTYHEKLSAFMDSNVALQGSKLQVQNDSLKVTNLELELEQQRLALLNKELDLERTRNELELNATHQLNIELEMQQARIKQETLAAEIERHDAQREQAQKQVLLNRRTREMIAAIAFLVLLGTTVFLSMRIKSSEKLRKTNKKLLAANQKAQENLLIAEENRRIAEKNRAMAEHSEQMKTMFIQNMSHEIRTPLNSIVGFSQLLTDPDVYESLSQEELNEFMGMISNNSNLLTTLVNDILNLSDLESGKYKMTMSNMNVNETCKMCMMNVESRVPAGVRMYYTTEVDDEYTLYSDQLRIQQVITNYLTNACKHTASGEIHIHTSIKENPGFITFSVTDTGKGVPADKAESIFGRFEKLDSFVQGTGLGLAICRLIADILHGEVKLDTSYTQGARFVFIHPISQPEDK